MTHASVSDWPTRHLAVVAVGGALGAGGRWSIYELIVDSLTAPAGWPLATFVVNVVGCLAIGFAARRLDRGSLAWDGVVTGVLGGFTTMSAVAVELNALADDGRTGLAIGYAIATLTVGVGATLIAGRNASASEATV